MVRLPLYPGQAIGALAGLVRLHDHYEWTSEEVTRNAVCNGKSALSLVRLLARLTAQSRHGRSCRRGRGGGVCFPRGRLCACSTDLDHPGRHWPRPTARPS